MEATYLSFDEILEHGCLPKKVIQTRHDINMVWPRSDIISHIWIREVVPLQYHNTIEGLYHANVWAQQHSNPYVSGKSLGSTYSHLTDMSPDLNAVALAVKSIQFYFSIPYVDMERR